MVLVVSMTPVMYTDISGEYPRWVLDVSDWLNENPTSNMNPNDPGNPFIINTSSAIFEAVGTKLLNYYDKVSYYRVNSPAGVYGKIFGAVGIGISLGGFALDIGNTWTDINSNTNSDRIMKTSLQGMKLVVDYTASYYVVSTVLLAIPTYGVLVPVVVGGLVIAGTYFITEWLVEEACDYFEIE